MDDAYGIGIEGYVLKTSVADELLFAAKEVLRGGSYMSPVVAQTRATQALKPSPKPSRQSGSTPTLKLTFRQREVLQLVAEGKSSKEIAFALNVTVKAIEFHKARISKELGVRTTSELTKQAIILGLIAQPESVQTQNLHPD